ncbi:FAD-dependent monooxygenase [Rhodoplanes sp. Z2-YC6860]|uniref:FAD-dependent monooxygenase n=1 Tax=Rhodoplanes sp. Z2-YC6860 TaxID=674703 RepID=UPI00078B8543|nr:FAD-dependent monooxygenase [Rhodoplanes sp. Z2-YC6860]AMN39281.1 2-polyprenyl-6-methoxyphenol hydroxylase-like oxidoreductase [Rhodoplanes sp. Z2-YC6860]
MKQPNIAIIGAGIGGMAAAIALDRIGASVRIFEQASAFKRVGAAINLTPNAVRILDWLGPGAALRNSAFSPEYRVSRSWDTGAVTSRMEMGPLAERKYGSPQLIVHRADLLSALEAALPPASVQLGTRLTSVDQDEHQVHLQFQHGSRSSFDAVVAADGIHSTVRHIMFGDDESIYTGMAAYRAIFPRERLGTYEWNSFVKWWGPDTSSQLVTAAVNQGREMFMFATVREPEPSRESWSAECDIDALRRAFAGYHAEAQSVFAACDAPFKTALYVRPPLDRWVRGRVALLGDACHPMVPFMAQGGAMALEDAAILSRCLAEAADVPAAFLAYEAVRRPRASLIQNASSNNDWLRADANADWVYGYDAWKAELKTETH